MCNPILKTMLYSIFMQISNTGKDFMLRMAGTLRNLSLQYWRRHYQGLCMNLCSTKTDKTGNEEFLHIGAAWEIKWRKQQYRGQKDNTLVQAERKKDKAESEKKCVLAYFIKDQVSQVPHWWVLLQAEKRSSSVGTYSIKPNGHADGIEAVTHTASAKIESGQRYAVKYLWRIRHLCYLGGGLH